jgi:hypothetical protein
MITVGEFRESTEALMNYIFEHETDDFIDQLEDEDGKPAYHIYFDAFVAMNAFAELDGLDYEPLWECLHANHDGQYFYCTERCGYIGIVAEPIQDRLILDLEDNEPVPSGVCPRCAGTVVKI